MRVGLHRCAAPIAQTAFVISVGIQLYTSTSRLTKGIKGAVYYFSFIYSSLWWIPVIRQGVPITLSTEILYYARFGRSSMVHVNIKSAAKVEMVLAVDVSVVDLPRVNAALQQLVASEIPESGPLEGSEAPPVYPADVVALGLPAEPRFYGELAFAPCPGTKFNLVVGNLTGQVPMRCQSCLAPFISQLQIDVKLAHIFSEEQESTVPEGYDSLIIDRQDLTLVELLEDDILLSLPAFPRHPEGQCVAAFQPVQANEPQEKKVSPFAGLKDLLQDSD